MQLKSIVINGFKSFHDKKVFQIDDGITGVVGPNGSGKSNVSDAVRWVLGEQSPKSLRGSKMMDVIFGGTDTRKKKSFCEVSMVFDNKSNKLDTDFDEVQISRKLYRSGESAYSVNKTPARLKDIQELFRDTGIGKEGYSIIGQGKIDEILTEKGTERRKIFEEAAGIMKYRVRKEEAERKLIRTKENLVRIRDIIAELELQVDPLKKQCEQAKKYVELVDRQKILEVNLYIEAYDNHSESINAIKKVISELEEEETSIHEELEMVNADFGNEEERDIDDKINKLNEDIRSFHMEIERLDGEVNLNKERTAFFVKDIERITLELDSSKISIEEKSESITDMDGAIENAIAEIAVIESDSVDAKNELADKVVIQQSNAAIINEIKSGVFENLGELSDVKSGISAIISARDSAKKRIEDIGLAKQNHNDEIDSLDEEKMELQTHFDDLNDKSEKMQDEIIEIASDYQEKELELSRSTTSLYDIEKRIEGLVSRKRLLMEMKDSFEGYYHSVKKLLIDSEKNVDLKGKIISTVAAGINVPKDYETAVEVALGNAMQNIIVQTDYDAKDLIEYLKRNDMGRVTFLPMDSLKLRHLSDGEQRFLSEHGVLGCASDLVSFGDEIRPAIEYLLARTVVVDNMDNALKLKRRSSNTFKIVTLQGEILNPGGVITGGSIKKSQAGLLSRERVLADMKKKEARLTKEADSIRAKFIIFREILNETAEQKDDLDNEQRRIEIALASVGEQLKSLEDKKSRLNQQNSILEEEYEIVEKELKAADYEVLQLKDKQDSLVGTGDETDEKIKKLEDEYEILCQEIEELKQKNAKLDVVNISKKNELESLRAEQTRLAKEILDVKSESEVKQKSIADAKVGIAELENNMIIISSNLVKKKQFLTGLNEQIELKMLKRKTFQEKAKRNLRQKEELHNKLTELSDKKHKAQLRITKAEGNLEYLQNKTWDSYELTYANALKFKTQIDLKTANKEIESIKSKIRNMGEVNPHAIEDYDNVKTRFDFMTKQETDLIDASDDLDNIISGLMNKMQESFEDKFKVINENFKTVFKHLFGGGNVDLVLEDKMNIMESGIQIVAEPPGKHLQNLMLLSGGEKALTAIALLFALLKINPSPLCILDEIDAALDDANVNKFAEYLKAFNNETQFVVITHRKPTMAICDVLYGLAMREKGVTEVLSVSVDA